jgi:hypothetical protein
VDGVPRWPPGDVAWAARLLEWAEAKRRGSKAVDVWMRRQKALYEAGMLHRERARVLDVLGSEWVV